MGLPKRYLWGPLLLGVMLSMGSLGCTPVMDVLRELVDSMRHPDHQKPVPEDPDQQPVPTSR